MKLSTPRIRTLLLAVALVALSFALVLALYTRHVRSTASSMLQDLTNLRPGVSSIADAEQYAHRFRRYRADFQCLRGPCPYEFRIQNTLLSKLHLEPPAMFTTDIWVQSGKVSHIAAGLVRSMPIYPSFYGSAGMAEEYAELPNPYPGEGHYNFPTPIGKPYLRVRLDTEASTEQRQHAFAFSFRCLTKLGGGCDLPCDYLPAAWRDWKKELQTSGFNMSDFDQTYRNNNRCD